MPGAPTVVASCSFFFLVASLCSYSSTARSPYRRRVRSLRSSRKWRRTWSRPRCGHLSPTLSFLRSRHSWFTPIRFFTGHVAALVCSSDLLGRCPMRVSEQASVSGNSFYKEPMAFHKTFEKNVEPPNQQNFRLNLSFEPPPKRNIKKH